MAKELAASDHLPGYTVRIDDSDMVHFQNREKTHQPDNRQSGHSLKIETYEQAKAAAPGWDIYFIEQQWREWSTQPLHDADASFLGFCRQWYDRRGAV